MAKKDIYKITVLKWAEYNKGHKPSYKKTQIANNFCTDSKILELPMSVGWLFLGLILECGGCNKDTVSMSEGNLKVLLRTGVGCVKALDLLQSFQLVTYEVVKYPLQNRKRIREERDENNTPLPPLGEPPTLPAEEKPNHQNPPPELHRIAKLWNENCAPLPKVREMNKNRTRLCSGQNHRTDEEIILAIKNLLASPFHLGKNDRGWKAGFDFFIRPDTFTKAVEGSFATRKPQGAFRTVER